MAQPTRNGPSWLPVPSVEVIFVGLVWLAATVVAFGLVNRYAGRTPYFDDFAFFPLQVFDDSLTFEELWKPLNEHRLPLPKLATWAISRLTGYNPKAIMRVGIALHAAAALAAIGAARRIRGRTRWTDSFFPLVILSLGQAENFLWAVQISYLLPTALLIVGLTLIARLESPLSLVATLRIGLCALLASLCGVHGQVPAVAIALWLVVAGALSLRERRLPAAAAVAIGLCVLGVILAAGTDRPRPEHNSEPTVNGLAVRYAFRVIGGGWGPAAEEIGPAEPTAVPTLFGLATALVLGLGAGWTAWALRDSRQRLAATGLLAFLAGMLALCAAIGIGRAALSQGVLANRYITLALPLLCWAFFAILRFAPPSVGRYVTAALALTAIAVAGTNADRGLDYAVQWDAHQFRIEQDVKRGVPVSFLVDHHGGYLFPPEPRYAGPVFETLRLTRAGAYASIPPEPELTELAVKWTVAAAPPPESDGLYRIGPGDRLRATLSIEAPPATRAIAIRASVLGVHRITRSDIWWTEPGVPGPIRRTVWNPLDVSGRGMRRIWLGRPVDEIHLSLDGPSALRIESVAVLVAADGGK